MSAENAIILGAILTGLMTTAGVIISSFSRSHDAGFSTLVKAFEALGHQNKTLLADLEAERAGRAKDRLDAAAVLAAKEARIAELERQLGRAYGSAPLAPSV